MADSRRLNHIRDEAGRILPAGPTLIALSGGADSAVAAWVVVEAGHPVRAIHVHHGLPDSSAMELAAKAVAAELGIDLEVTTVVVPDGPSPEAQARAVRRAAIEASAAESEWLVTGHQLDDVAETVADRLARGSGSTGLAAIRPIDGRWVRPLLSIPRADVRAVAAELGIPFVDDPSNDDLRHRRNRIRNVVSPVLAEALGADAIEGMARSARLLAADDAALEMESGRIEARRSGDEWYLAAAELAVAHPSIASRAVRRVLRSVHGGLPGNEREVAAAMSVAAGSVERADLSGAWSVVRDGAWVVITATPIPDVPEPIELPVPGAVAFGPYRVAAQFGGPRPIGRSGVALTAALWDSEVEIRAATPGERIDIRSISSPGSKKVSDALAECGIPSRRRAGWPVLSARGNIAWIAGCRPAPWATPGGDGEEEPVVVTFRRPPWSR